MSEEGEAVVEHWQRPTGQTPMIMGYTLLAIGVIAALIWGLTDTTSYSGYVDSDKLRTVYWAGLLASACGAIALPLILTGYIVRALYFLPGEERKRARN
ncbi:hypothetical protein [Rhizorhabdus sp.]|uniref:hypothetical protein n=1 Tax=Rhizorhabdus sp. TaxID=1968843 RepID=UPI0035AD9DF0